MGPMGPYGRDVLNSWPIREVFNAFLDNCLGHLLICIGICVISDGCSCPGRDMLIVCLYGRCSRFLLDHFLGHLSCSRVSVMILCVFVVYVHMCFIVFIFA